MEEMYGKVKLIVSEVDGIITEGLASLDNLNNTLYKEFFMRDFEAINLFKKYVNFVFLSSDNNVSYNIMRNRNIPFFWAAGNKKDNMKTEILGNIMRRYSVSPEETLYLGCNFSDVECVKMIPLSFCPYDAVYEVKRVINDRKGVYKFDGELGVFGGGGVISTLYEVLLPYLRKRLDN